MPDHPPTGAELPISQLVNQLIEDGRAYAHAQIDYAKVQASVRGNYAKTAGAAGTIALIVGLVGLLLLFISLGLALRAWFGLAGGMAISALLALLLAALAGSIAAKAGAKATAKDIEQG
jgi:hypothetical protein